MSATTTTTTITHPRRTPARAADADTLIDAFHSMSLRKGDTVHALSTANNEMFDGITAAKGTFPSNPLRSTTCPKSLEELLIGSGERRAAELLKRVDDAIAAQSKLALSHVLNDPEVLPKPAFASRTEEDRPSGIANGDASLTEDQESLKTAQDTTVEPSTPRADPEERGLSDYAKDQIHKHIIKPILREPSLKEFHSLLKGVPRRIGNKEITTLRDLERALIFAAPEYTPSPSKYLQFCERTIRVLHTTVATLHESDQKAPAERPYTQGYFVDLVEQIRRYATILAATREKQARGEKLDEMDVTPDEVVSLQGGVSHNGKQAELVRHKDGKVISIASGQVLTDEELASSSMGRPSSDDVASDEVLRSMARRKKNALPEIHECSLCDKEFKRPCDLTKHVKTHERPWKCTQPDCKYHTLGWPTEKERDRHVNDKHSSTPSLYHCLFKPCPYTSKRESNCKQHMEKAHGWQYVRSKNNGKSRAIEGTRLAQGSIPPSPSSSMMTPLTPIAPSPSVQSWSTSSHRDSMPPPSIAGPSNYGTPAYSGATDFSGEFSRHFNMDNFNFNDISDNFQSTSAFPMTPAMSEDRRTSMSSHGVLFDGSVYDDAITPDDMDLEASFRFDGHAYHQQPTPDSNLGLGSSGMDFYDYSSESAAPSSAYISPHVNSDMAFISSQDQHALMSGHPNEDFTLFGTGTTHVQGADMFPAIGDGSGWTNLGSQLDFSAQLKSDNSALNELFPELKDQM